MSQTIAPITRSATDGAGISWRAPAPIVLNTNTIAPITSAIFTTSMIQPLKAWTSRSKVPFLFVAVDMASSRGG